MDVVVLDRQAERIYVMLNEGTHRVFCELKPTQSGLAYVGRAMGLEIVYERSRAQVQSDIDGSGPGLQDPDSR